MNKTITNLVMLFIMVTGIFLGMIIISFNNGINIDRHNNFVTTEYHEHKNITTIEKTINPIEVRNYVPQDAGINYCIILSEDNKEEHLRCFKKDWIS